MHHAKAQGSQEMQFNAVSRRGAKSQSIFEFLQIVLCEFNFANIGGARLAKEHNKRAAIRCVPCGLLEFLCFCSSSLRLTAKYCTLAQKKTIQKLLRSCGLHLPWHSLASFAPPMCDASLLRQILFNSSLALIFTSRLCGFARKNEFIPLASLAPLRDALILSRFKHRLERKRSPAAVR